LAADVAALFSNHLLDGQYFELINQIKQLFMREQVLAIREAVRGRMEELVNKALENTNKSDI